MSRRRKKLTMRKSKRLFSRTAKRVHGKNGYGSPMRGGIRL